jgi:hypothetical protein
VVPCAEVVRCSRMSLLLLFVLVLRGGWPALPVVMCDGQVSLL